MTAGLSPKFSLKTSGTEASAPASMVTSRVSVAFCRATSMRLSLTSYLPFVRAGHGLRLPSSTCDVALRLVHQLLHLGISLQVAVHVELVFLVTPGVRLDGMCGVDHVLGGGLDVGVDPRPDGGQHRRAEGGAVAYPGERDRHVGDVGVHL